MKESIFSVISKLAKKEQAINLGQGFPDFDGPDFAKKYVTEAMAKGFNQYAPMEGVYLLREKISELFQRKYNLNLDTDKEITITSGASEAIFSTIMALVEPGDKVLAIDPIFDIYQAAVKAAGGIIDTVKCEEPDFNIPVDELKNALKKNYKLILINTPHNPSGYMWKNAEYKILADYLEKNQCYLMSDEVYEFITFDEDHISPIQNEAIRNKVIKVSSGGKTFGMTGWKVGWFAASAELTVKIRMMHQNIVYAAPTPLQYGIAHSLNHFTDYELELKSSYKEKRDFLFSGLQSLGWKPLKPRGGYFILCEVNHLLQERESDEDFGLRLIKEKKVATIPLSPFYISSSPNKTYVRFCLAKKKSTLEKALDNLTR